MELTKYLSSGIYDIELKTAIPNVAYIEDNEVKTSSEINHTFIDLTLPEVRPDFKDYFEQITSFREEYKDYKISLFIEGSRSCHWKKCQFCYLNTGYKYRTKSVQAIEDEIRTMIQCHRIYNFSFLDNDLIGNDWERFSSLLDALIAIKEDYPDFTVILAEIITKNIHASYIRKMAMSGFQHVQIGYESPSNTLLKK